MSEHKLTITLDHETMQRLERYSKRWDLSAPLTGAKLVYVGLQRSDALTDWGDKVKAKLKEKWAAEDKVIKKAKTAKPKAEKPAEKPAKAKAVAKPKPTKAKAAKVVKAKPEAKQPKPVAMTLAEAGMAEPARAAEPVLTKAEVAEAMAAETPAEPASPPKPASKYLDVKVGDKIFDCDPRRQAEKVVTKVMPDHLYIQLPGNQGVVSSVSRESVHTDRTKKKGYALVSA